MTQPFSLDELIPEPLTATLDGHTYEVRTVMHLGPAEYGVLRRLQRRAAAAVPLLERDGQASDDALQTLADATDQMLALLVPELPAERLARISFGRKSAFLEWWQQQHPAPPPGEAPAAERTPARRSRGSSSPATIPRRS